MAQQRNRVHMFVHDGQQLAHRKPITREFNGMLARDITKKLFKTDKKEYNKPELKGEEIIEIEGIRKNDKDKLGFQFYYALIKGGEVIEMGLPGVDKGGKEEYPSAGQLRINLDDIEEKLKRLPDDVEIAIVWRLDKDMTQDIVLGENSMISHVLPSEESLEGFSLLDKKPCVGCGGGFGGDGEAVYDLTEVFIYTGEQDDPISLSNIVMAVPPESLSWDSSDSFSYLPQVLVLDGTARKKQQPIDNKTCRSENVTDFTSRMYWQDELNSNEVVLAPLSITCQLDTPIEKTHGGDSPSTAPVAAVLIVCKEILKDRKAPDFKPEDNPIIRLLMNPTERRLWGRLYGLPDEDVKPFPLQSMTRQESKPQVHGQKGMCMAFRRIPAAEPRMMLETKPSTMKKQETKSCEVSLKPPILPKELPQKRIQLPIATQKTERPKEILNNPPSCIKTERKQRLQKIPVARKKKQRKMDKPVETCRKIQRKEPELRPRVDTKTKESSKVEAAKKPKIRRKPSKQKERKVSKKPIKRPIAKKPKSAIQKKQESKKMHSYFKNRMLGLYEKAKRGRTRAGSSGRRR